MSEESRVTAADISGLRDDTRRLADSIESVARRQDTITTTVEGKAEQSDVDELVRLANRANINSALAAAAVVIALAAVIGLFVFITVQRSNDDAKTYARRVGDCHSLDDVAAAAEAAANGAAEGTLKTFLDPVFQSPDRPATPQAVIDLFVQKLRDNTHEQVHNATVMAINDAKKHKGYSVDCTQIGTPPKPGG